MRDQAEKGEGVREGPRRHRDPSTQPRPEVCHCDPEGGSHWLLSPPGGGGLGHAYRPSLSLDAAG